MVKHRRKIWSIPIAVLALVMMLAGALAVSGIVQAQAANIVKGGGDIVLGAVVNNQAITTITVEAAAEAGQGTAAVPGIDDDEAVVAVVLSGADAALFGVTGAAGGGMLLRGAGTALSAAVTPIMYDHDGDGTGQDTTPLESAEDCYKQRGNESCLYIQCHCLV